MLNFCYTSLEIEISVKYDHIFLACKKIISFKIVFERMKRGAYLV